MCVVVEKVHFFARPEWIRIFVDARAVQIPDSARSTRERANERANERDGGARRASERERDVMNDEGRV